MKTSQFLCFAFAAVMGGCAAPAPTPLIPFSDGRDAVLFRPLKYQIGKTAHEVEVPAGFVTDFASTPRMAWSLFPPFGQYQAAAIVHDYLYWEQGCTREEADRLFLYAMEESGVDAPTRYVLYEAVRLGGQSAWDQNAKDKTDNKPKIISPAYMQIPAKVNWREYRILLANNGEKPAAKPKKPPSYCAAMLDKQP